MQTNCEGIALSFRWGIGTTTNFRSARFTKTRNTPDYGVPFYKNRPLRSAATPFYGTTSTTKTTKPPCSPALDASRFQRHRHPQPDPAADYQRDVGLTAPRLQNLTDATVADGTAVVRRSGNHRGGEEHTLTVQSDLSIKFATGAL